MEMDSGLQLVLILQTASRRVPMELLGPDGVPFLFFPETGLLMPMDSGLPLVMVQTKLRQVPMGLLGLVARVLPFLLVQDKV